MQSDVGDSVVSIAIEISHNAQLFKLNQNEPLEDIIQNICDENGFEYAKNKYSLQFVHRHNENDSNLPHYVTEENRYRIKNGSELKLFHSAPEFVKILQTKLSTRIDKKELSWALSKLSVFSSDATFASNFFFTGYPLLRSVIEESSLTTNLFNNCLRTFLNFIKLGYITELDEPFLIRLKNILNSEQVIDEHIIENSLQLLDAIIYTMNDLSPNFITINDLIPHIWNRDSPAIQGYAIALINGLALKLSEMEQEGDLLDQMNSLLLRENILKNVISSEKKSSFMSHNLYVYQTLILSLELTRFNKLVSENTHFPDIELNYHYKRNKFKSFSDKMTFKVGNEEQCVKCPPKRTDRERSKTVVLKGSSSNLLLTQFDSMKSLLDSSLSLLQKDDFSSYDVDEDLNISLNQMTHDCIIYFAHNYRNEYRKTLVNEFHLRFLKTCCQVTDFLVKDILKIGQPPLEDETLYYPLVFSATVDAPFFEELFSCAMILLAKTRKEMNAKTEADLEKVFQVFKRQLNEGLASQPHSFNQLSSKLSSLTYSVVSGQWQEERCEKEKETFAKLPSIKQLRESLINETLELIKTQRINYLIKGTQFPMWNAQRSQRIKNKMWFVSLTENKRFIQYQENFKNESENTQPFNLIGVSQIHSLVTGKKCPHIKESKGRPTTGELAFSLILNQDEPKSLDFIAPNQEVYDYWTDGINALIGQKMKSSHMKHELNTLIEMELRVRLLDIEGIELPIEAPPIPADPPNYNFLNSK